MPYITVRNTPNHTRYPENLTFVGTCTYIDCAYAINASSLEPEIVSSLQATLDERPPQGTDSGYCSYRSNKSPHTVLNVLERYGYRVVAAITINQTAVWTLHKQG